MTPRDLIDKLSDTMDPENARRAVDRHDRVVFLAGWQAAINATDRHGETADTAEADYREWIQRELPGGA